MFHTGWNTVEQILQGQQTVLAVTAASRASVLPDTPTLSELAPGYDATIWWGIAAPLSKSSAVVKHDDGREEIVGGGRYVMLQPGRAKAAFTVVDHHQGRGLGTVLLRH